MRIKRQDKSATSGTGKAVNTDKEKLKRLKAYQEKMNQVKKNKK